MTSPPDYPSLYQQLLGPVFDQLQKPLQDIHDRRSRKRYTGLCRVLSGEGWVAAAVARAASLPTVQGETSVSVLIERDAQRETWTRRFGTHVMRSTLEARDRFLEERLGLMTLTFDLRVDDTGIEWVVKRARVLFLPLPAKWFAGCTAKESIADGRYRFDVRAEFPGVGLIAYYQGWLLEDVA